MQSKNGTGPFRRKKKPVFDCEPDGKSSIRAADIRIAREVADIDIPEFVSLVLEDSYRQAKLKITPPTGLWEGATFVFDVSIPISYPWDGITCICRTPIVHPNIDTDGQICLNILRPWKPTYTIQTVVFGLILLFIEPNAIDPLNVKAGLEMRDDPERFRARVHRMNEENKH
jgi:ubiquitin-protein ligase